MATIENMIEDTAISLVRVNCARCGDCESIAVVNTIDYERSGPGEFEVVKCLKYRGNSNSI